MATCLNKLRNFCCGSTYTQTANSEVKKPLDDESKKLRITMIVVVIASALATVLSLVFSGLGVISSGAAYGMIAGSAAVAIGMLALLDSIINSKQKSKNISQ